MSEVTSQSLTQRAHWKFAVTGEENGFRLDQVLPLHCQGMSRGMARKIIDIGGVHVAGRRVRSCSRGMKQGDEVCVYYDALPLDPYTIAPEEILFRDRDLIALNKPAGVETQPTPARFQGTLFAALTALLIDPFRKHVQPTIGMVQRLDRETSGVILFSISHRAHKPLTATVTSRALQKTYLALVAGTVPPGEHHCRSLLARSHRDNSVRSVQRGGQEAVTEYRLLQAGGGISLVEVKPVTGRMHQIRVHLSEAGFPLLGDKRYGGPESLGGLHFKRHMLHAYSLQLPHPVSGQPLTFTAPLPADFHDILKHLQITQDTLEGCTVSC